MKTIHIGNLIRMRVKEQKMTVVDFAKQIYKDRSGVYRIFKDKNIDTGLLMRICEVLEYNFFAEYCNSKSADSGTIYFMVKVCNGKPEVVYSQVTNLNI